MEMKKVASKLKHDDLKDETKLKENSVTAISSAENKSVSSDQLSKKGHRRGFKGIRPKISASYSNSSYNGRLYHFKVR